MASDVPASGGARFCPAWYHVEVDDDACSAVLARAVTDGYPEPRAGELAWRWFSVTAIVGVAVDEDGQPATGEDADVTRIGRGDGILLVTDRAVAAVVRDGEHDGDMALAFCFDLDDVVGVEGDRRRAVMREHTRSLTVELEGASWGAVGLAVTGEAQRVPGQRDGSVRPTEADDLVALLAAGPRVRPSDPQPD